MAFPISFPQFYTAKKGQLKPIKNIYRLLPINKPVDCVKELNHSAIPFQFQILYPELLKGVSPHVH